MKLDGLLRRNRLKRELGDALHTMLCSAGHNIRLILRTLRIFLPEFWRMLSSIWMPAENIHELFGLSKLRLGPENILTSARFPFCMCVDTLGYAVVRDFQQSAQLEVLIQIAHFLHDTYEYRCLCEKQTVCLTLCATSQQV